LKSKRKQSLLNHANGPPVTRLNAYIRHIAFKSPDTRFKHIIYFFKHIQIDHNFINVLNDSSNLKPSPNPNQNQFHIISKAQIQVKTNFITYLQSKSNAKTNFIAYHIFLTECKPFWFRRNQLMTHTKNHHNTVVTKHILVAYLWLIHMIPTNGGSAATYSYGINQASNALKYVQVLKS